MHANIAYLKYVHVSLYVYTMYNVYRSPKEKAGVKWALESLPKTPTKSPRRSPRKPQCTSLS